VAWSGEVVEYIEVVAAVNFWAFGSLAEVLYSRNQMKLVVTACSMGELWVIRKKMRWMVFVRPRGGV
jgi:hypothetical protein